MFQIGRLSLCVSSLVVQQHCPRDMRKFVVCWVSVSPVHFGKMVEEAINPEKKLTFKNTKPHDVRRIGVSKKGPRDEGRVGACWRQGSLGPRVSSG
jgi:hypothetical protein